MEKKITEGASFGKSVKYGAGFHVRKKKIWENDHVSDLRSIRSHGAGKCLCDQGNNMRLIIGGKPTDVAATSPFSDLKYLICTFQGRRRRDWQVNL